MKISKLTLCVWAAIASAPASAADLLDVYRMAVGQDAAFAAARASQQAGQEKQSQGRSLLMPSVNLTANSTYNDINVQYTGGSRALQYNNSGYGVSLVQPLFRQQSWMSYSESELQVAISEAQYKLAQHDLILRVAQGYFDVLIAQDSVQLTEAQKKAISEQLEQAKRNFEVGTATITDTYEAQARYDLVVAQEISAQSNLEIKKRTLQQITNSASTDLRPLGNELKFDAPQPGDAEKWVEEALQHNLQVAIAEAGAELADKEVSRTFGGHLPTLDLVANYSMNSANGGTFTGTGYGPADTTSKVVGIQLNMPLFQGGATQSKYREAEAGRDKAKQDLENARRTVAVQTRQAYLGVANGIAQVKALQQALKSSESLLEASKLGQGVGVRTNLDVLNAQQQLFSTRRDLYQAEYNYLLSRLRLKAAVGTLTEEDINGINQALR
jgi:outer membrane protein